MADNPTNVILIPSPRPVEVSLAQVVGITRFGSYIESLGGSFKLPWPWAHSLPPQQLGSLLNQVWIVAMHGDATTLGL